MTPRESGTGHERESLLGASHRSEASASVPSRRREGSVVAAGIELRVELKSSMTRMKEMMYGEDYRQFKKMFILGNQRKCLGMKETGKPGCCELNY